MQENSALTTRSGFGKLRQLTSVSLLFLLTLPCHPKGVISSESHLQSVEPRGQIRELQSQLIRAIWNRDLKIFESLLSKDLDPNFLFRLESKDQPVSPLSSAL